MKAEVEILLSTYNGEKFLAEQIESILAQTYGNFILTIKDDFSTDGTMAIIEQYIAKYPAKIRLFVDPIYKKNMGSTFSFGRLMQQSEGKYLMLSDQDDVWMENKVEISLKKIKELEVVNPEKPVLVFTDMIEVDKELNQLNESFIKHQKLSPKVIEAPTKVLAMNVVAGCTTIFNRACINVILPFPSKNVIHDHWMAINVSHYGVVEFLNEATLYYRQHGSNVVGANNIGIKYYLSKVFSPLKQMQLYNDLILNLNFKINVMQFVYYKTWFNIKRLFQPKAGNETPVIK